MIVLEDVSVEAHGNTLLAPVSLDALAGDIVAVRGRNGAGKSTVLRTVAGLTTPTRGQVTVRRRRPDRSAAWFRRSVAVMMELPPFARDMTVAEHLGLVLLTWRGAQSLDVVVDELLDRWTLSDSRMRFPHELSTGQRQLLGLGLVTCRPSDVLILDEPEQRLDSARVDLLGSHLRELADAGTTVLLATHSDRLQERSGAKVLNLTEHA